MTVLPVPLPLMPMLCGRLEGFDMLSVTLPALARIVDLLNFSFDLSADSL